MCAKLWMVTIAWLLCGSAAYGQDLGGRGSFNPPKDSDASAPAAPSPPTISDRPDEKSQAQKRKALAADRKYKRDMETAASEANVEITACKNKYLAGKLRTHTQMVNCYNTKVTAIFSHAGYRYPDLLRSLSSKRMEIARLVDKKVMSDSKGEAVLAEFSAGITKEEQKRDADSATAAQ